MEEKDAHDRVAVDAPEGRGLAFGQVDEPQDEGEEQPQHEGGAEEALLFADGTEDEVGVLFGHVFQFGLCAVQESFAFEASRADGDHALVDVVAGSGGVFLNAEEHADARLLVGFEHVVEHVVRGIEQRQRAQREEGDVEVVDEAFAQSGVGKVADDSDAHGQLHPGHVEGHDEERHEHGQRHGASAVAENVPEHAACRAVGADHAGGEEPDEHQHAELAHRCERLGQEHRAETHTDDEINDRRDAAEEEAPRHSFTVEHQEEGQVDEGRARLALHHDEHHRCEHHRGCAREVFPVFEREAVLVH